MKSKSSAKGDASKKRPAGRAAKSEPIALYWAQSAEVRDVRKWLGEDKKTVADTGPDAARAPYLEQLGKLAVEIGPILADERPARPARPTAFAFALALDRPPEQRLPAIVARAYALSKLFELGLKARQDSAREMVGRAERPMKNVRKILSALDFPDDPREPRRTRAFDEIVSVAGEMNHRYVSARSSSGRPGYDFAGLAFPPLLWAAEEAEGVLRYLRVLSYRFNREEKLLKESPGLAAALFFILRIAEALTYVPGMKMVFDCDPRKRRQEQSGDRREDKMELLPSVAEAAFRLCVSPDVSVRVPLERVGRRYGAHLRLVKEGGWLPSLAASAAWASQAGLRLNILGVVDPVSVDWPSSGDGETSTRK